MSSALFGFIEVIGGVAQFIAESIVGALFNSSS